MESFASISFTAHGNTPKGREVKIARSKVANITRNVSERIHAKNLKNEARLLKNAIFLGDMSSFAGCKRRRGNDKIIG